MFSRYDEFYLKKNNLKFQLRKRKLFIKINLLIITVPIWQITTHRQTLLSHKNNSCFFKADLTGTKAYKISLEASFKRESIFTRKLVSCSKCVFRSKNLKDSKIETTL